MRGDDGRPKAGRCPRRARDRRLLQMSARTAVGASTARVSNARDGPAASYIGSLMRSRCARQS